MKFDKVWQIVLGVWLIFWGALTMDWFSFSSAGDILGIGALIAGVLTILDK